MKALWQVQTVSISEKLYMKCGLIPETTFSSQTSQSAKLNHKNNIANSHRKTKYLAKQLVAAFVYHDSTQLLTSKLTS